MWSTTGESEFIMADRLGNIYPSDKCCPFLFPGKPGFPGIRKDVSQEGYFKTIIFCKEETKKMKTDIEIAQECKMEPITAIAEKAGIDDEYLEQYGKLSLIHI